MTGGCGTSWHPHWNWTASTLNVLYLWKSKGRATIRPLWACSCQGFLIAEELKREAIAVRQSKAIKMQTSDSIMSVWMYDLHLDLCK